MRVKKKSIQCISLQLFPRRGCGCGAGGRARTRFFESVMYRFCPRPLAARAVFRHHFNQILLNVVENLGKLFPCCTEIPVELILVLEKLSNEIVVGALCLPPMWFIGRTHHRCFLFARGFRHRLYKARSRISLSSTEICRRNVERTAISTMWRDEKC